MNSLSPITQLCLANEKSKAGLYPARGAGRARRAGEARSWEPLRGAVPAAGPGCGSPWREGRGPPPPRLQDGWRRPRRPRGERAGRLSRLIYFSWLPLQPFPKDGPSGWVFTLFPPGLQLRSSSWRLGRASPKSGSAPRAESEDLPKARPRRPVPARRLGAALLGNPY